jgi:two-component system, OmpR family, sensor histidine kinase MtrB
VAVSLPVRRLERVVTNLVDNANRYGGGLVRIALESVPGASQLVVEDAGPGVKQEERRYIFERFARGATAKARGASDGAGLGLSLVTEHAHLHGGTVWAGRLAERGAPFIVRLPIRGSSAVPKPGSPGRFSGADETPRHRADERIGSVSDQKSQSSGIGA